MAETTDTNMTGYDEFSTEVDPNSNNNTNTTTTAPQPTNDPMVDQQQPLDGAPSPNSVNPEEERLNKNVATNPQDFNSWTSLIQIADRSSNIEKIREYYDGFLAQFPLCFLYWKRYSDHELLYSDKTKQAQILDRAVKAVPHSIELWSALLSIVIEDADLDEARRQFERAVTHAGLDSASGPLWDKYIEYETSKGDLVRVSEIFTRIFQIPLENLSEYTQKYRKFVDSHPLSQILTPEETAQLERERAEVRDKEEADKKTWEVYEAERQKEEREKSEREAIEALQTEGENAEQKTSSSDITVRPALPIPTTKTDAEIDMDFKLKVLIPSKETLYKKATEEREKRKSMEQGVAKRTYFHVKQVDDSVLFAWRRYLEFEEKEGNQDRIKNLYERSLVACAYYSEFWIRYVRWLERSIKTFQLDSATTLHEIRGVFQQATTLYLKKRPIIYLEWAYIEELHKNFDRVTELFDEINHLVPGHIETIVRHAAFLRRRKNESGALAVYENALQIPTILSDSKAFTFLSIQYAKFVEIQGRLEKSREIFETSASKFPSNKNIWRSYIAFETSVRSEGVEEKVRALYERALGSSLTAEDKQVVWVEYLEYVSEFASDISTFIEVDERFKVLYPHKAFPTTGATSGHVENRKRTTHTNESEEAVTTPAKFSKSNAAQEYSQGGHQQHYGGGHANYGSHGHSAYNNQGYNNYAGYGYGSQGYNYGGYYGYNQQYPNTGYQNYYNQYAQQPQQGGYNATGY